MPVFDHPEFDQHEALHFVQDSETGLQAIIAIHSTALGPAAGGFLTTLGKGLTNEDGTPAVSSTIMEGMPPRPPEDPSNRRPPSAPEGSDAATGASPDPAVGGSASG